MIAHAPQGRTFENVAIVDLWFRGSSSAMSSYVAWTLVQQTADLLILRPLPQATFRTRTHTPGLEVWRGEDIDWQAIENMHHSKTRCSFLSSEMRT